MYSLCDSSFLIRMSTSSIAIDCVRRAPQCEVDVSSRNADDVSYIHKYSLDLNNDSSLTRLQILDQYKSVHGSTEGVKHLIDKIETLGCAKYKEKGLTRFHGIAITKKPIIETNRDLETTENTAEIISQLATGMMKEVATEIKQQIKQVAKDAIETQRRSVMSKLQSMFKPKSASLSLSPKELIDLRINQLMIARNHIDTMEDTNRSNLLADLDKLHSDIKLTKSTFMKPVNSPKRSVLGTTIKCSSCLKTIGLKHAHVKCSNRYYAVEDTNLVCTDCMKH